MKNKVLNILITLAFQFIILPLIGYSTILLYQQSLLITPNSIIGLCIILSLVIANLAILYELVRIGRKIKNYNIEYYSVIGLFTLFILIWLCVILRTKYGVYCEVSSSACLELINQVRGMFVITILNLSYYVIFLIMWFIQFRRVNGKIVFIDDSIKVKNAKNKKVRIKNAKKQ